MSSTQIDYANYEIYEGIMRPYIRQYLLTYIDITGMGIEAATDTVFWEFNSADKNKSFKKFNKKLDMFRHEMAIKISEFIDENFPKKNHYAVINIGEEEEEDN